MKLNSTKSCVIWFQPRRSRRSVEQPAIVVNNMTLQLQLSFGLIYDNRLTWTDRVSNICKKICDPV